MRWLLRGLGAAGLAHRGEGSLVPESPRFGLQGRKKIKKT